jgi:hypothetical protein
MRRFAMTTATVSIDHQIVHDSFCQWHAEQDVLDAQLADSVAALEAYQSHLDAWQQDLAAEREELRQLRAAMDRDQALAGSHGEHLDELGRELSEARPRITALTTALLTRTEELRELDRLRVQADHQLAQAKAREKELVAALDAKRNGHAAGRQPPDQQPVQPREQVNRGEKSPAAAGHQAGCLVGAATDGNPTNGQATNGRPQTEPKNSANPVLGSVMEQFGKLRQQRSLGRQNNPKPR